MGIFRTDRSAEGWLRASIQECRQLLRGNGGPALRPQGIYSPEKKRDRPTGKSEKNAGLQSLPVTLADFMTTRGRLAPTPTGLLHVGHARTFATAAQRAAGSLVMRMEDLDLARSQPEFAAAALEDLRWLGLDWPEGPDCGGPFGPYNQSERDGLYRDAWQRLVAMRAIYPSPHSRRDLATAATAPHPGQNGESIFPPHLRPAEWPLPADPGGAPWRFRVPDGRKICFVDGRLGTVTRTAGSDFGDFVVWRRENLAAYELAVVVDDHLMGIEEVVRGEDLLTSTARQLLLYETLDWPPPRFFHTPLITDAAGQRLAKRTGGLAIRDLRLRGLSPAAVLTAPIEELLSGPPGTRTQNKRFKRPLL